MPIIDCQIYVQYFSRRFTLKHILPNIQLPAIIKVYSRGANVTEVTMVMNMSTVKGVPKGGAMITSHWMDVVRQNDIKKNQKYVFWFRKQGESGLKIMIDSV
jgi:hypothetical protein